MIFRRGRKVAEMPIGGEADVVSDGMSGDVARRLNRQLEVWRQDLLALDRRQRLLYFKHTKSASLEIGTPTGIDLLELVTEGEAPLYAPATDAEDPRPPAGAITVANKAADTLKTALRRLDVLSQQTYADKGVWTLYLGIGVLRWVDPADGAAVESPLLMVPVQLKRTGTDSPFVLFRTDDDVSLNPALKLKMDEFGIDLPDVDPDTADIEDLWDAVESAIDGRRGGRCSSGRCVQRSPSIRKRSSAICRTTRRQWPIIRWSSCSRSARMRPLPVTSRSTRCRWTGSTTSALRNRCSASLMPTRVSAGAFWPRPTARAS
ncbi:DUF4011 domain-containing protein [Rhodococcus hoagii]|nr:DUF4011 domain-containing protein [Prescottella equi]